MNLDLPKRTRVRIRYKHNARRHYTNAFTWCPGTDPQEGYDFRACYVRDCPEIHLPEPKPRFGDRLPW
jgi:hypothetical protein